MLCQTPTVIHPSVSDWFQWAHPSLEQTSHFPAPPTNTLDTHQLRVLPPPCCLHPSCSLWPQAASPHGMEGDPKTALVSLPARSACPQLESQSDTSVKYNPQQDALGSRSSSCQPPSIDPPPKQLPRDPKHTPGANHSLKPTAAMGPAHLGGTSGAVHPPPAQCHTGE